MGTNRQTSNADRASLPPVVLFPLARRNQPQWLQIAAFLSFSRPPCPVRVARAADGVPACGEWSDERAARAIPHGNHGDNGR
jgi:hypothetical protein